MISRWQQFYVFLIGANVLRRALCHFVQMAAEWNDGHVCNGWLALRQGPDSGTLDRLSLGADSRRSDHVTTHHG